jgi:prepilin-type N-terminal cleavage/methylation domain-containing protein
MSVPKASRPSAGFTLLEVLLTLGIVAAISAAILPNLGLTQTSQMNMALRDVSNTIRSTYDAAVFSGRIHRLVFSPLKSEYWAEQAPFGYEGRPPLAEKENASTGFNADARARLLEELEKAVAEPRKSQDDEDRFYTVRSLLVQQRKALTPIKWSEVDDAILYKRNLPGDMAFHMISTQGMPEKMELANASEKDFAYLYFFPNGEVELAALQLAIRKSEKETDLEGPKFTLFVDPLSGQSEILEGHQDPEFLKDAK